MQKPLALSIAVCLGLTGCQLVETSPTWETVMSVRPGDSFRKPDPSYSYAEKLHGVLLDQGIEHIVVTYQYRYYTHQYEQALGTRTAIVYRDAANSSYPWWLKDDRTATPFWLPNGDLDNQISFYAHRPAQVIEKKVYPARGGSGKAALAHFRPAQVQSRDSVAEHPRPVTKVAQSKPAPTQPAKAVVTAYHPAAGKPVTPSPKASPMAVTRIQRPPTAAISKPKSASKPAPTAAIRTHFRTAPAAIAPVAQAPKTVLRDKHLEKLFRMRNGTSFDAASAMDRRKMGQLKGGLLSSEVSGERGFRDAVDGRKLSW